MAKAGKRPNIMVFMVDEERFPVSYESEQVKAWRKAEFKALNWFQNHGLEFNNHYAGSAACVPSRATIFTGQYPSLHGVTQTTGTAKESTDPDVFWLDPSTVPTMGDYFRAGGYRTYYRGKWHVSHADIMMPGTHTALHSYDDNGRPVKKVIDLYKAADRLDEFGFSGWIGPEPHGSAKANTGTNRDPGFARETIELIEELEAEQKQSAGDVPPWLIVNSFVNPHDIVLFGLAWKQFGYPFKEGFVPNIGKPQTESESLDTKPGCQSSYVEVYPKMLMPQPTLEIYRQFYYYLQKESDQHIWNVLKRLMNTSFFENTIIIFTSDHGEMLGAHGGMHQKWHNAYEETVHVPFIISHATMFKESKQANMLTSHVDLIPTLLGLAGINQKAAQKELQKTHSQAQPLVGRDLTKIVTGKTNPDFSQEPIYFMTDDEISSGLHQENKITGKPYASVIQPNHIETVIADLREKPTDEPQIWKYSRYFDNPQFWTDPFNYDVNMKDGKPVKTTKPQKPEFEMYNVSEDKLEQANLAHASNKSRDTRAMQLRLEQLLTEQRNQKRIYPAPYDVYENIIKNE
ncbi:MAG: sulfatase-like hydrolase/transferase [Acidobacteria bacterium]|nr:sulfatase-like hydrolase/transferase [Acidobacteriota bacterium]